MKIIIFILTLCMTFSSFASSGSLVGILNDHRYFVEVEWDQKDMSALATHENLFGESA